jgi:hypothetical protein
MNALDKAALRALLFKERQNVPHRRVKEDQIAQNLTALLGPSPPLCWAFIIPFMGRLTCPLFGKRGRGPWPYPPSQTTP